MCLSIAAMHLNETVWRGNWSECNLILQCLNHRALSALWQNSESKWYERRILLFLILLVTSYHTHIFFIPEFRFVCPHDVVISKECHGKKSIVINIKNPIYLYMYIYCGVAKMVKHRLYYVNIMHLPCCIVLAVHIPKLSTDVSPAICTQHPLF